MSHIKNIIFDLGGVIMNLDVIRTIKAFHKLGIKNIVNNTGHNYHHYFFYDFELGNISEEQFQKSLQNLSTKKVSFSIRKILLGLFFKISLVKFPVPGPTSKISLPLIDTVLIILSIIFLSIKKF